MLDRLCAITQGLGLKGQGVKGSRSGLGFGSAANRLV